MIDYKTTAVEQAVHDVDMVFDSVGATTLTSSAQVLKQGGTLVTIAGQPDEQWVRERNIQVASFSAQVSSEILETFARLIKEGHLKVVIEATYPLRDAGQAHTHSQSGHGRGRVVLRVDE